MRQSNETAVHAFIKQLRGTVQPENSQPGEYVQADISIAGHVRTCRFAFGGDLIRTVVIVDGAPEDTGSFMKELEAVPVVLNFYHRINIANGYVAWIQDLIVPNCSIAQLLGKWQLLAEMEIAMIDGVLENGIYGARANGRFESRVLSVARN